MSRLFAFAPFLLASPAMAGGRDGLSEGPPPLGDLQLIPGQTTFYFDVDEEHGTDIRVFHDGAELEVEALGRCLLPTDTKEHFCFRAASQRTGLLTLRVDVGSEGRWTAGEELLVGLDANSGAVVAHLPHWLVFTYGTRGTPWAVGLGGEWSSCMAGRRLPAPMDCRDGHWAFPASAVVQIEVQHPDGPIRRSVIPVAAGVYTFYRSGHTIWGDVEPAP